MKFRMLVAVVGLNACFAFHAHAAEHDQAPAVSARLDGLSDSEINDRLRFAEEKLDYRRRYAQAWQYGWIGFYGLGIAVQGYNAGKTHSAGKRADYIQSCVKSVGGIADKLIRPLRAVHGADPLRTMPDTTRDDRLRKLALAEQLLRTDAEQSDRRYSILRHFGNIATNSIAAVIVSQAFDTDDDRAWRSAAVGIGVGEIMIISQPWWGRHHLEEYESRFGGGTRVSWQIVPTFGGAAIQATF